ncbi:MAG: hypothetical protein JKY46_11635 [Robiginitomaculum sp.]|nr:hypothetical protein [Robiginitomaculum sp.]
MPERPQTTKSQSQLPLVLILIACAIMGFVLTLMRDGWAEDVAWLAVSICLGALVMLFFDSRR